MKWNRKGVWQTMVQPRNFSFRMRNFHELEIMLPTRNVKTKGFSRQANMSTGFCVFTWNDITFLAQIPFPPRMKLARTQFCEIILLLLWHVNFFPLPWLTYPPFDHFRTHSSHHGGQCRDAFNLQVYRPANCRGGTTRRKKG